MARCLTSVLASCVITFAEQHALAMTRCRDFTVRVARIALVTKLLALVAAPKKRSANGIALHICAINILEAGYRDFVTASTKCHGLVDGAQDFEIVLVLVARQGRFRMLTRELDLYIFHNLSTFLVTHRTAIQWTIV